MKRWLGPVLAAAAVAAASGCGGGLVIGIGGEDDDPPSVSLAVGATSALPGQVVRLAAAASDDDFVDEVRFYRIEPDGRSTFLGSDGGEPFDWDAAVPADAPRGSTVRFFARAIDSAGQGRDSSSVSVLVS